MPTTNVDSSTFATGGDATLRTYGNMFAHELGHIFGLGHRGAVANPVTDGLAVPNEHAKNPEELALVAELAGDLGLALHGIQAESALWESEETCSEVTLGTDDR